MLLALLRLVLVQCMAVPALALPGVWMMELAEPSGRQQDFQQRAAKVSWHTALSESSA
jgi:hypothetical protein